MVNGLYKSNYTKPKVFHNNTWGIQSQCKTTVVNGSSALNLIDTLPDTNYCIIIAFSFLPAGSAAGSSAGISFTHGLILGFFAPQGQHVAPIKVKFGREERADLRTAPPCQI